MTDDEQVRARAKRAEIESAERKFSELVAKRDELNRQAIVAREERNALNQRKRELLDTVQKLKLERDEQVALLKEHKRLRDRLHEEARALLKQKRTRGGKVYPDLPREAAARKAEIEYLDLKQQTQVLTLDEEKELIKDIKRKADELRRLEEELKQQDRVRVELGEMDASLDELFKKADGEHALVVKHYGEAQRLHERMMKLIEDCSALHNEADKKHRLFLELRERADVLHKKAVEMRERILSLRSERRVQAREARRIIEEQNRMAQRALTDPEGVERKREEALEQLLKKGKISL
ncbi:MAG: DUF7121 family protein [Thermoplasmatota archaeon]